MDKKGRVNCYF